MQKSAEPLTKALRIGDLQEHRYPFARAWKKGAWPHEDAHELENIDHLVRTYWDPKAGRFKSWYEVMLEKERAEDKALEAQSKKPAFVLPANIIDDWTGQKYLEPC